MLCNCYLLTQQSACMCSFHDQGIIVAKNSAVNTYTPMLTMCISSSIIVVSFMLQTFQLLFVLLFIFLSNANSIKNNADGPMF